MGAEPADIDDGPKDGAANHQPAVKGLATKDLAARARQNISRIENSAGDASPAARDAAQDVEDRMPERQAAEPQSLSDLKAASRDLKQRIDDEKRKHDMPINSSLGDPAVDARNADGHNDLPDEDDP